MNAYNVPDDVVTYIAQGFEEHGKYIYQGASPLYAHISAKIATDSDILTLVAKADRTTTFTNLFFAAVQFLLLSGIQHSLRDFYPNLSTSPRPLQEVYPYFRDFCLSHADEIQELVTTRRVQTNEVRRCAILFPAFKLLSVRVERKPLAIVEIGSSAGLHLLWDRYSYDYGEGKQVGDTTSSVRIISAFKGTHRPLLDTPSTVAYRVGLDINPIDVYDDSATLWLRALIWPEHADRIELLEQALTVARCYSPTLVAGDASVVLPEVLARVPQDMVLCIFHSYTLNQMPGEVRERILEHIAEHAQQRDLYRISQEGYSLEHPPQLELHTYRSGKMKSEVLALCESHGRWIEWMQK
jgi:hypothetical protein